MFAGPNGSGKSTIKAMLPANLLGVYLNPDEIEAGVKKDGYVDMQSFDIETTPAEILPFFTTSEFLANQGLAEAARGLTFAEGRLCFPPGVVNSYFAAVATDFLRQKLLEKRVSFSFETVMSSPDKVLLFEQAQRLGYRTYLYYISTDDPLINLARVKARVNMGGHDVPEDKIVSRYHRSMNQLLAAIRYTNRAYLFDNSRDGSERLWVAEITEGHDLVSKCDPVPPWFQKAVLEKIPPQI